MEMEYGLQQDTLVKCVPPPMALLGPPSPQILAHHLFSPSPMPTAYGLLVEHQQICAPPPMAPLGPPSPQTLLIQQSSTPSLMAIVYGLLAPTAAKYAPPPTAQRGLHRLVHLQKHQHKLYLLHTEIIFGLLLEHLE